MARLTKIYTRTGDPGTTQLGGGQLVAKDDPRIEAYGTVDELNAAIGVAIAQGLQEPLPAWFAQIQNDLFHLGSDLCIREEDKQRFPIPQVEQRHVTQLEGWIDQLTAAQPALENFVLPGGSAAAAQLHVCRTTCRRAERRVITLGRQEPIGPWTRVYLNRLSDLLFVMARHENLQGGHPETIWNSRA